MVKQTPGWGAQLSQHCLCGAGFFFGWFGFGLLINILDWLMIMRFRTKSVEFLNEIFLEHSFGASIEEIARTKAISKKRVENSLKKPRPLVFDLICKDQQTEVQIEKIVAEDFEKAVKSSVFKFKGYFSGLALKQQWRVVDRLSGLSVCVADISTKKRVKRVARPSL